MDIKCKFCLEPIDMDEFHYMDSSDINPKYIREIFYHKNLENPQADFEKLPSEKRWSAIIGLFKKYGCSALNGYNKDCKPTTKLSAKGSAIATIYDLLGSDIDGAASMLEDMDMFYFE